MIKNSMELLVQKIEHANYAAGSCEAVVNYLYNVEEHLENCVSRGINFNSKAIELIINSAKDRLDSLKEDIQIVKPGLVKYVDEIKSLIDIYRSNILDSQLMKKDTGHLKMMFELSELIRVEYLSELKDFKLYPIIKFAEKELDNINEEPEQEGLND